MIEPERKSVSLAGGALSFLEWENTGLGLHFAHANGFNAQTYKSLLQPLSGRFHILASDARGHGFSTLPAPPGYAKGWACFRDDLIALLDALEAGPVLLAGHSMGGIASLMAAAARPDLVAGLVLVEPVFVPRFAHLLMTLARWTGREGTGFDLATRAARRRDVFASAEEMEKSYRGRGAFKFWPDNVLHDYVAGGTVPTEDGRIRLSCAPRVEAESFASTPIAAYRLASRIACPVTLIHGLGPGSTCRAEVARQFTRRKADTRVVAVEGAGHFLPMERPEMLRAEINRMADSL